MRWKCEIRLLDKSEMRRTWWKAAEYMGDKGDPFLSNLSNIMCSYLQLYASRLSTTPKINRTLYYNLVTYDVVYNIRNISVLYVLNVKVFINFGPYVTCNV